MNDAVFATPEGSEALQRESNVIGVALLSPQSRSAPTEHAPVNDEVDDAIYESQNDLPESSSILPNDTVRFLPYCALETRCRSCEVADVGPGRSQTNWEYHGPRSYLSICSRPAVQWVSEQTQSPHFTKMASDFASDITRRLKMDAGLSSSRAPEPDPETAWRYTAVGIAYFDHALDAALGILHRPWFEQQLAAHLSGIQGEASPTWHALRNVVYAAGCRIELSKSCSFQEASQKSWVYFEDALTVYARLLFFKTSITGVQVLTLMAYYAQTLAGPCLEYMLSADAVRLAFAKGLHRATSSSQNLTSEDIEHRNRIFWAIYCLEKQIASQASRPSIIDDDEVTCPIPSAGYVPGAFSLSYCHSLIRISKVSSHIEKGLSAVRCSRMGAAATVQAVHQFEAELVAAKDSIYGAFGLVLGETVDLNKLPNKMTLDQCIYVQVAYCTAMLSVHTVLAYPWMRPLIGLRLDDRFRDDIARASDTLARISRQLIKMTEHIHFRPYTPVPVAFFGPIYALISLFVYCLDRQKTQSDLASLDVGTGYFARLHLATDSLKLHPFARAIGSLAYDFERPSPSEPTLDRAHGTFTDMSSLTELGDDFWQAGMFQLEDWSTFSRASPAEMPLAQLF
ncbi:hypothetical protein LTR17_005032 [Elasticomyces elasticus]|nr:hypothetical protein LTR17_005032 [Elasticomyces elasticus]